MENLVTYEIIVEGKSIGDTISVVSISIESEINSISFAKITVLDGDLSKQTFEVSESSFFLPGKEIEIKVGYNSDNKTVFKGIISGQSLLYNQNQDSFLEVSCYDKAIRTTVGRKNEVFFDQSDGEIVSSILGNYVGQESEITSTTEKFPHVVQYNLSDWDFIVSRARNNGMFIGTFNGKLKMFRPSISTSSLRLSYGRNIISFKTDLESINQLGRIKASNWDIESQDLETKSLENTVEGAKAGNLTAEELSKVIGLSEFELQTPSSLSDESLMHWGQSQLVSSSFSRFRGRVNCKGTVRVSPAATITLNGLGKRFDGDHYVSKVSHDISEGRWTSEFTLGLPADLHNPLSIKTSSAQGLFTGKVIKIQQDPENQYRILVDVPLFDVKGQGIWARYSNFYASQNAGAFFLPEINDEVVLGFINNNADFPVILGSLYSNPKNKPYSELTADEQNTIKAIVTKSGIKICFDDDKKMVLVTTPQNNSLVLSDEEKKIVLVDQNKNTIELSEKGITINSNKDIKMNANGEIAINSTKKLSLNSKSNIDIEGLTIDLSANLELLAKGSARTSIASSGQVDIKGSMININ